MTFNTDGQGQGPQSPSQQSQGFDFMLRPPGEAPAQQSSPADFGLAERPRRELRAQARVDSSTVGRTVGVIGLVVAALAVAGVVTVTLVNNSEAQTKAASKQFCAAIAETPGQLSQPAFGWPTDTADLPTTLAEIQTYADRWSAIAAVAPDGIAVDTKAVADGATAIINAITTSKTIDRAGNLAAIEKITSASDIAGWAKKYCN